MEQLVVPLQTETLAGLTSLLFDSGRPAFLKALECGVEPIDRLCLANALEHARHNGYNGVAEDVAEINARAAWLTKPAKTVDNVWEPLGLPFLVFTSAGDANNNVAHWVSGESRSHFELCVVYYGDQEDPDCLRLADRSLRSAGGKFPNLLEAMRQQVRFS